MHTVYFLGAGFSKNFGYPLTTEIMPQVMEHLLNGNLFQLAGNTSEVERVNEKVLLEFIYKCYPGLRNANRASASSTKNIPGIIEILSLVDHFCLYNIPPHPAIVDQKLSDFKSLLNRSIGELLVKYDRQSFSVEQSNLFRCFIEPVRALKAMDEQVSIITTNYDLLIDRQFRAEMNENKVDYGIPYRSLISNELVFRDCKPLFHYYKLHGSLNWLKCELCGQYYINSQGSIVSLAFRECLSDDNTCICSPHLKLKSVLVAPSFVRDVRDSNLLQIWKSAHEAMRTADKIIFIGYSLPPEDLAIRSIIMRALNGRRSSHKLRVDVVVNDTWSEVNYTNLFGSEINYHSKGLVKYLGM